MTLKQLTFKTLDQTRRNIKFNYEDRDRDLVLIGIEAGVYNVTHDPYYFRVRSKCCICRKPCESGNFILDANHEPVCDICGKQYASKEEIEAYEFKSESTPEEYTEWIERMEDKLDAFNRDGLE